MTAHALAETSFRAPDANHGARPREGRPTVCIVTSDPGQSADVASALGKGFAAAFANYKFLQNVNWAAHDAIVIDAGDRSLAHIPELGELLGVFSHLGKPVFLAVDGVMRSTLARMGLLNGVNTFTRPIADEQLPDALSALIAKGRSRSRDREKMQSAFVALPEHGEALIAADEALERIFEISLRGGQLDMHAIEKSADAIIGSLEACDIASWIAAVREHHDSTFQHCLLVTGTAIAFGLQLGFRRGDLRRIAMGALMHDIGKAKIPAGILDKPTALTAEEEKLMRRHPEFGLATLSRQPTATSEIREIVLNHHEYLDGSGYPNGLRGGQISDIVRLVTIADIFGALIERRAYRPAMSGAAAYEILLGMRGKIDMAIVRAVRQTAFKAED